jgi:Tol biopolymer transport system component
MQSTAIYIVQPDGSGLRRLTKAGGYYGSPHWSPDGRRIVCYESGPRSVSNRLIEDPEVVNNTRSQIVSIDVATGAIKSETSGPGIKVSPRYVNGGIAYISNYGPTQGVLFTDGRRGPAGSLRYVSWSPDGKSMVYHRPFRKENVLTPAFSIDQQLEFYSTTAEMLAFSPRGDRLAMTRTTDRDLLTMNRDGTGLRVVMETGDKVLAFPTSSPDGSSIAFGIGAFFERPAKAGQIALIRPDGTGYRTVTDGKSSAGFANWSPDGKRLVYRVMGSGEQGLRILNLEDNAISKLTNEYDTFPMWSPRGDRILFCSFRSGDYDLYTIRPNGSEVRRLTDGRGNDAHPCWSPDGNWILFSSSRKGFKDEEMLDEWGSQPYGDLFLMRPNGSELRQLTDNQWEEATPAWRPIASAKR